MCGGCSLQVPACLRWVMRLLGKWYTGRFSVPYFILIFANVKIKDESELQQGFNQQEKDTQGGLILFGNRYLRAIAFNF